MKEAHDRIDSLLQKLEELQKKQELFNGEILQLQAEITTLKKERNFFAEKRKESSPGPAREMIADSKETASENQVFQTHTGSAISNASPDGKIPEQKIKSNIERFIGENLINKIGIAVIIIGVGIGTKYAIDHKLISPLARIIMGYLLGLGLLFTALWLKKKYENFSAVLLSGSMAIMYFITYAAYSFFSLYPQLVAFILMVFFTVFTVTAALRYNREIIAIIGLVGAYAVPFLLSDDTANVAVLLSYISIINIGILVIAVKKYWKTLYISAFLLSWLIFFSWFAVSYHDENHFAIASMFSFLFFVTFYLTFLLYKIIRKEKFVILDIVLLLSNSFIFYGFGYAILSDHQSGDNLLGLYTFGNAIIHLLVSIAIYRNKMVDRNLFLFISGLVIVFITIAIPVQLSGNWVTLLWICEAALLLYIGRTRGESVYETISYPLIMLSFLSIFHDWMKVYIATTGSSDLNQYTPFLNIDFLSYLIYISAFSFILFLYFNRRHTLLLESKPSLKEFLNYLLPLLFIIVVHFSIRGEIAAYWNQLFAASKSDVLLENDTVRPMMDTDLKYNKMIWLNIYSLFFFAVVSIVNMRYIRNRYLGIGSFIINSFLVIIFLFGGLYILSELRESYLTDYLGTYFTRSPFNLYIRYISFVFISISLISSYIMIRKSDLNAPYRIFFSLLVHGTVVWILCSELLNIMDISQNTYSYKFGLSILFGLYSLLLFALGISGRKQHLRIAGMALFGMTLLKLFFYDITRLDTVLKTVLFLSLGILLLIVSFLYIKYKKHLFGEPGDPE